MCANLALPVTHIIPGIVILIKSLTGFVFMCLASICMIYCSLQLWRSVNSFSVTAFCFIQSSATVGPCLDVSKRSGKYGNFYSFSKYTVDVKIIGRGSCYQPFVGPRIEWPVL